MPGVEPVINYQSLAHLPCVNESSKSKQLSWAQINVISQLTLQKLLNFFIKKVAIVLNHYDLGWFLDTARTDNICKKNGRCSIVIWIFKCVVNFMTMITYFWEHLFCLAYKVIYSSLSMSERKQNQNGRSN